LSTSVNDRDRLARLEEALSVVRRRIATAADRAGRDTREVRLVAVTKRVEGTLVEMAVRAGLKEFGENYVQELETKRPAAPEATWHFLGRVQRNKAKRVVESADLIHTLEPGRSAERLAELASSRRSPPGFLIEVDFAGSRVGVAPEELDAFADSVVESGADLRGLMTVAPLEQDPRPWFARLRELGEAVRARHPKATELSMGMSTDLEVAVEEGATMVRVGTAIFGPRR
jgi:pyridoxal phosphate enzyme (YggS family)